jgi:hypothetical protein
MNLTEEIFQHVKALPDLLKAEVLDFVEYLEFKSRNSEEETDWSNLSLTHAMRDIEKEASPYTIGDLKENF